MSDNILLEVSQVGHNFGDNYVLYDVNLKIITGEFVALVGPSGCGKSTLLRGIVGTHPPKRGTIALHNQDSGQIESITKPTSNCGIVYQRYSLYPNLTARENVAFGLMLKETSLPQRLLCFKHFVHPTRQITTNWRALRRIHLQEAEDLLVKLKLSHAIRKYPHELSGGMCQRVAIAQALIMKPRLLLLDEPFGALDEATREELQTMLLELYAENIKAKKQGKTPPYTIVIVTHELNEAILVGDRVLCLSQYWASKQAKDPQAQGAATIVYDDTAPVYQPQQQRSYDDFVKKREEILRVGFDPNTLQDRETFQKFWAKVQRGEGEGILSDE
jgi:NitT/TauT family transport system ATP-binding protein